MRKSTYAMYGKDHSEALEEWLDENTIVYKNVREAVLFKFDYCQDKYSGSFHISVDGVECPMSFTFSLGQPDGHTLVRAPSFHSPLAVPASFSAVGMPSHVLGAIQSEISTLFPRVEPYGLSRVTGIDTDRYTPMSERIRDHRSYLQAVKTISDPTFEIQIKLN